MCEGKSGDSVSLRSEADCPFCDGQGFTDETYRCCDDHGLRRRGCDDCGGTGYRTDEGEHHASSTH